MVEDASWEWRTGWRDRGKDGRSDDDDDTVVVVVVVVVGVVVVGGSEGGDTVEEEEDTSEVNGEPEEYPTKNAPEKHPRKEQESEAKEPWRVGVVEAEEENRNAYVH